MEWKDPPREAKKPEYGERYAQETEELQKHPGQWAVVATYPLTQQATARTTAARMKKGIFTMFRPAGFFEARTAVEEAEADGEKWHKGEKVANVYARYTGGRSSKPDAAGSSPEPASLRVLRQLTAPELKDLARELGITGTAQMRREQLIMMITAHADDG